DGRGARHDGDRPAAPERQAAGQEDRRARLDPRGQQGDQQHHPLGRRRPLQDPPHLREGAGVTETKPAAVHHPAALAPLSNPAFRGIWIANLLSNVGGWMQSTGAAWEMTSLSSDPLFVALLAAAGTLPMFLFVFFAGILADRFERKRYIIVCQCWMM